MKKHVVKSTFLWDDGNDTGLYLLKTPADVTEPEIKASILVAHKFLCEEDKEDRYGTNGRCSETLLAYLCEKNGWNWEIFEPDIEMDLF